ncbi:MAG: FxsA family protein [Actinomycetes bacterium]
MPLLAFFVFVVFPAVEIYVIVRMVELIGFGWTLVALVAGAALGLYVMRRAGSTWWQALRGRIRTDPGAAGGGAVVTGPPDGAAAARAALLFLAGLLIFLPGFVSDAVGLVLLLPPVRALLQAATAAWFVRRFTSVTGPGGVPVWTRRGRVVPGQVVREDSSPGDRPPADPPSQLPPGL